MGDIITLKTVVFVMIVFWNNGDITTQSKVSDNYNCPVEATAIRNTIEWEDRVHSVDAFCIAKDTDIKLKGRNL